MALMLLLGISSAWGAKTTLKQGETITFIFSQGDVPQNYGWNSTQLHIWDDSGNDKTFDFNGQHVLVAGDWIPTKFQFLSKYEHSGWKGKTSDIGDCGGKTKLQPNTTYSVKLAGKDETDWIGSHGDTGFPNKQFKITLHCIADCTPTVSDEITIKCSSNESKVYAWVWGASTNDNYNINGWPGDQITDTDSDGVLDLTISTTENLNIIFSNGSNQTGNILGLEVGKEYTYSYKGTDYTLENIVCIEPSCTAPYKPSIEVDDNAICKEDNTPVTITVTGEAETFKLYTVTNNGNLLKETKNTKTFTVEPKQTTTYVVKALNGTCESDFSDPITVTVNETPDITLESTSKAICKGEQLDLSDFASSTVDLTWWNGDTQITEPVSPEQSITYTVKAVNGACAVSKDFNVTVTDLPDAPTNLGSATICNGDKVTLPEVTGSWYTDATTTTPLASISIEVNPAETTSYFATSKSNNCESSSRTEYVVKVKSLASANNYELTKTTAVYTGTAVTLQTSDVNVTNNAGTVSTIYFKQNGNTVNPINVGEYDVYVTTVATDDICAGDIKIGTFTITQATQTGFVINNTTLNICGTSVVVTSTGGQGGDVTYIIETDNTTTKDATINSTTGELKVNSAGTVIVTATKAATTNYEAATYSKEFTFIMLPNVALTETSISVCSNEEINLSEYVNEYSGTIKWYSDSEYKTEITELTFIPNNQIYYVKATNGECTPATAELDVKVTQVPAQPELDTVDPQCDSYTLPTEDKKGLPIKW